MSKQRTKSLVESGQEVHDAGVEVYAAVVDAIRPVIMAVIVGFSVLLKKRRKRKIERSRK